MVVVHYTAMGSAEDALARLCDPAFEVSAHYLIDCDGRIMRLIDEDKRAWHAGAGQWGDVMDVNSHSIGIELANQGNVPFAAAQIDALENLLHGITARHAIRPERIIGHSDMAPTRKIDPGPRFDWLRLARQGLGVWPNRVDPVEPDIDNFVQDLRQFGYPVCADILSSSLSAFRDRFRPHHSGPLDGVDMAIAKNLAIRFPVDRTGPTD
jgi:N-acetylmuramoyl-L-alanine amidase